MPEPLHVLYEDNHLLVVEKPANMPVQADASGDDDLLSVCKAYIKVKYQKPGEVYLGLVHRLDRPVGGVMVFARTSKAAARLTAQFKSRQAQKHYVAIVSGTPLPKASLSDWLYKDERTNTTSVVPEGTEGAKLARLDYKTLAREDGKAIVDIALHTGRPHQIRVQLSARGLPIEGDMRYNPSAKPGTQIRLWAYALTIMHPTLNEPLTFYSMPPWKEFPAQVQLLPAFSVCSGVYVDDELLVVDKASGVEVEGELLAELTGLFDPLYPVHRLDANTEGLVAFARTESMQTRLENAFYRHDTEKVYHAILCGTPREGHYTHYAQKDADGAMMHLCRKDDPNALTMELAIRVLESRNGLSLCEIELFTGRTHQIRVQTAAIDHPVLGDDKYGDREQNRLHRVKRQMLLAKRLTVLGHSFESEKEWNLSDVK